MCELVFALQELCSAKAGRAAPRSERRWGFLVLSVWAARFRDGGQNPKPRALTEPGLGETGAQRGG